MVRISVMYPSGEGKTFDHAYYIDTHMALVRERWGGMGLVRTEVDRGVAGGAPDAPAPYIAVGHVYFNSSAGLPARQHGPRPGAVRGRAELHEHPAPGADQRGRSADGQHAYDVIVVGGGNAAMCAALSAREGGARVLVVEKAPEAWRGGNGFFTAGGFRFAFKSFEEVCEIVGDLSDEEKASMDVAPLHRGQLLRRPHAGDRGPARTPTWPSRSCANSQPTMRWMKEPGDPLDSDVRPPGLQGRRAASRSSATSSSKPWAAAPGLIDMEYESAPRRSASTCGSRPRRTGSSPTRAGAVTGVEIKTPAGTGDDRGEGCRARPSGGFEANVEMRTRYLGPNWDLARVRGTPYNTVLPIRMALDIGAQPWGHWSGCHAVQWDYNAPWHGDRKVGDNFQKHSYPIGLIVNIRRPAVRGRGRRHAQLHVRQVRPRGDQAAAAGGVPDLRSADPAHDRARSTGSAR